MPSCGASRVGDEVAREAVARKKRRPGAEAGAEIAKQCVGAGGLMCGQQDAVGAGRRDPLDEPFVVLGLGVEGGGACDLESEMLSGPSRVGCERGLVLDVAVPGQVEPLDAFLLRELGQRDRGEAVVSRCPNEVPLPRRILMLEIFRESVTPDQASEPRDRADRADHRERPVRGLIGNRDLLSRAAGSRS